MQAPYALLVLAVIAHAQSARAAFIIPDPEPPVEISLMSPKGIKFQLKPSGQNNAEYFHAHFNINTPLPGVTGGQFNSRNIQSSDDWTYNEPNADVKPGDTVYYWMLVHFSNGQVHQWTDRKWTAASTDTTTTPTEVPTTATDTPTTAGGHGTDTTATGTTATPSDTTTSAGNHTATTPSASNHTVKPTPSPTECTTYPCLIFEDNFDVFDFKAWEHEITAGGGGNWEFQYYLNNRSNSYVRDGNLYIKPTLTADRFGEQFLTTGTLDIWGNQPADTCTGQLFFGCYRQGTAGTYINPIQSARLRSVRGFNFKYGKVEIKAKMPQGDWIWPALWLLPTRQEYGLWPASGEIDLAETRGNKGLKDKDGKQIGIQNVGQTLHWGPFFPNDLYDKTHVTKDADSGTYATDFHTFGAEWDEDHFSFFLDGKETLRVDPGDAGFWKFGELDKSCAGCDNPWKQPGSNKMAPFDKEFYIIMNVAVGGTNGFFPDDAVNVGGHKPWTNKEQEASRDFWNGRGQWYPTWNPKQNNGEDAAMKVDYVKVWKLKPDN